MKKIIAFVLAIVLLCPAALADVQSQVNAPEHVTDTFQSNTGKTIIQMDASVKIPSVSAVPVYEVGVKEISAESLVAFADWLIGNGNWRGDTAYGSAEKEYDGGALTDITVETLTIESLDTNDRGWSIDQIEAYRYRQNGQLRGAQIMNLSSRRNLDFAYNYEAMHERVGADAVGCVYTREEAIALAKEAAAILAPELTEIYCGVINQDGEAINHNKTDEAYLVCFTRNVGGIPVTWTMQECATLDEDKNGDPIVYRMLFPYESLRLVITNEGVTGARYESPYDVGSVLQENAQLLQFEQIMKVARNILPLKYTWLENTYQVKIHIDHIVFGYTRTDFKDDMNRFMLVPVWDFFGTYECLRNGQAEVCHSEDGNSLLTINAMDGTIIDRNYGY